MPRRCWHTDTKASRAHFLLQTAEGTSRGEVVTGSLSSLRGQMEEQKTRGAAARRHGSPSPLLAWLQGQELHHIWNRSFGCRRGCRHTQDSTFLLGGWACPPRGQLQIFQKRSCAWRTVHPKLAPPQAQTFLPSGGLLEKDGWAPTRALPTVKRPACLFLSRWRAAGPCSGADGTARGKGQVLMAVQGTHRHNHNPTPDTLGSSQQPQKVRAATGEVAAAIHRKGCIAV